MTVITKIKNLSAACSAIVFFLVACQSPEKPAGDASLRAPADSGIHHLADTACFIRISGNNEKDTALVQLIINGEQLSGKFTDKIWEKDARQGMLTGTIRNNDIRANYTFMQEGITDSLLLEFKLIGNTLLQKAIVYDKTNGKPVRNDSEDYPLKYTQTDCSSPAFQ